jgi:dihydroflavonol-4-reductase
VKALVLGANGHIGSHLVRALLLDGCEVRGLVRRSSDLRALHGVPLELVEGDVRDRPAVERAMEGRDCVFHLAAPTVETPEVLQIALDGTRNVLEAARVRGVERVVYTSSVVTLGYSGDPAVPVSEDAFRPGDTTPYQAAKFAAEAWLRQFARVSNAPQVVTVNPTTTVGPLDYRPTPANRTIVEFMKRGSPFSFEAGLTVADVEDVARGHLLAARNGLHGEAYILGGEPMKVAQLFGALADLTGLGRARLHFPRPLMIALAAGLEAASLISRKPPLMTVRQARDFVGRYGFYSSAKAARELGYTFRPAKDALKRAVLWFLGTELIPPRRRQLLEQRMQRA